MIGITLLLISPGVQASEYYTWPEYDPNIAYDYFDEYGTISPPTMVMDEITNDDGSPVGTYTSGWWCFRYGSDMNPDVTETAWINMVERFNEDFSYITDVMRWPRDKRVLNGYYSAIYLFGSGLSTDDAPNTAGGGWMGTTSWNGDWWPNVLASYLPVAAFDPDSPHYNEWQQGAMVHEGIHAVLAGMPGCFNSCWFHEGGNTWLQGTMGALREGRFDGLGWLSCGSVLCPFMPIECYSGWLQDGSFGGPCAQGVNIWDEVTGEKLCTWRNLTGGVQYSEAFPHALEVILGAKSIAWIWRNAEYSGRVLQDLAEAPGGLGDAQLRRVIQEYRARQAFCDFGQWSYAFRRMLNDFWRVTIQEEYEPFWIDVEPWAMTCYVATTESDGVLVPEPRTLPGWTGANQIPLKVSPSATEATIGFDPMGENMSCQLVYRDNNGAIHYGVPVDGGACSIPLDNVKNNVIVAVVCNTDYIYVDDSTRRAKYDYRLTMGSGITGTADIYGKWFDYNPSNYTVTATATGNGIISPSGEVSVNRGSSQTFAFAADFGYEADEIVLNGLPIGELDSYTLNNVQADHAIEVTFRYNDSVHYEFENNLKDSQGMDDAVPTGSPTYTTGQYGRAIDLDGSDDYLTTPFDLSDVNDMTVAVWINWDGGSAGQRIFDFGNSTSQSMYLTAASAGNTVQFVVLNNGGQQIVETAQLATDQWIHVAVTLSGNTATLFMDGIPVATNASVIVNLSDMAPTNNYIGKGQGSEPLFDGRMNDFRIYKVAMSHVELLDIAGIDLVAPAAPTGLAATPGNGVVMLDWNDSDPDTAYYEVYHSTTRGSGYITIASGIPGSHYVDDDVINGTTYYYVVTASDASDNTSEDSQEASATLIPLTPVGMIGINVGLTKYSIGLTQKAGVTSYGYDHANWNNVGGNNSAAAASLIDDSGVATTLSMSWTGGADTFNVQGSGDKILTGNFVHHGVFILTDIPYASYDLVLYYNAFGDSLNDSRIDLDFESDGSIERTVYIKDRDPGLSDNGSDYVEFISDNPSDPAPSGANFGIVRGLTSPDLTIEVVDDAEPHNSLAGFQIIGYE